MQVGSPSESVTTAEVVTGANRGGSTVLVAPRKIDFRGEFLFTNAMVEVWRNDMSSAFGPVGFNRFVWRTEMRLDAVGRRRSFVV